VSVHCFAIRSQPFPCLCESSGFKHFLCEDKLTLRGIQRQVRVSSFSLPDQSNIVFKGALRIYRWHLRAGEAASKLLCPAAHSPVYKLLQNCPVNRSNRSHHPWNGTIHKAWVQRFFLSNDTTLHPPLIQCADSKLNSDEGRGRHMGWEFVAGRDAVRLGDSRSRRRSTDDNAPATVAAKVVRRGGCALSISLLSSTLRVSDNSGESAYRCSQQ
jgi:hypothetical protein